MQIHYELAQAAFRFMFDASTNYSMHKFANIFVLDLVNNLINLLTQHTHRLPKVCKVTRKDLLNLISDYLHSTYIFFLWVRGRGKWTNLKIAN